MLRKIRDSEDSIPIHRSHVNCQVLPQKDGLDSPLRNSTYNLDLLDFISSKTYVHVIQTSDSDPIFHKPVEENNFFPPENKQIAFFLKTEHTENFDYLLRVFIDKRISNYTISVAHLADAAWAQLSLCWWPELQILLECLTIKSPMNMLLVGTQLEMCKECQ